jgi:hypothetical protein
MRSPAVDIAGISLIACLGLLCIIFPQKTYELFIYRMGRDSERTLSPERESGYRLFHRACGAIMFLGGITMLALFVLTK